MLPTLSYQVYFQDHTEEAVKELAADVRRSLRAVYRGANGAITPPEGLLKSTTNFLGVFGDAEVSTLITDLLESTSQRECRYSQAVS